MNKSPKIHTGLVKFRCEPNLIEAFKEVIGNRNLPKVFREFMKETVEKAKKTEEKAV